MKSSLTLSGIFKQGELTKKLGKVVRKNAAEVKEKIPQIQRESVPRGRLYKKGAIRRRGKIIANRIHRASAPGQPPAIGSSKKLSRGYKKRMTGKTSAEIYNDVPYAAGLEYSTARIEPRPSAEPALAQQQAKFAADIKAAIDDLST